MSDICDGAYVCDAVEARGGVFTQSTAGSARRPLPRQPLTACACGSKPVYRYHPPLTPNGPGAETLECPACGNSVGPYTSRQALAEAWRLGGMKA